MIRWMAVAGAALLLLPIGVHGQANTDSVKHRNDCRLAAQTVTTGRPAVHMDWALRIIRTCPRAGGDLARTLSELRTSSDTGVLKRVTAPTDWLIDGRIVEAALAILKDRGASMDARIFAVRPLIWSLSPGGQVEYGHLFDADGDGRWSCGGLGPSLHGEVTRGEPLPSGWVERVHSVARAIHANPAEPTRIRQAAGCLALTHPDPYFGPASHLTDHVGLARQAR